MTAACSASNAPVRVLCLGNELLADDAVGIRVGHEIERRWGGSVDVVCSPLSGLHLIDEVLGARRLIVVDSIATGAKPGTVRVIETRDVPGTTGGASHGVGLFDVLAMARNAGLAVPAECVVVTIEAADCASIGGPMHPDVEAAIPAAAAAVGRLLALP